jgi:hypothetical protein
MSRPRRLWWSFLWARKWSVSSLMRAGEKRDLDRRAAPVVFVEPVLRDDLVLVRIHAGASARVCAGREAGVTPCSFSLCQPLIVADYARRQPGRRGGSPGGGVRRVRRRAGQSPVAGPGRRSGSNRAATGDLAGGCGHGPARPQMEHSVPISAHGTPSAWASAQGTPRPGTRPERAWTGCAVSWILRTTGVCR